MRLIWTFLLLVCMQAHAQIQLPNETDLRSAYCIAVTKMQIELLQQSIPGITDAKMRDSANEQLTTVRARWRRLQLYLLPRLSFLDIDSILAAGASGKSDMARLNKLDFTAPPPSDIQEAAAKIGTCNDLNWLPI